MAQQNSGLQQLCLGWRLSLVWLLGLTLALAAIALAGCSPMPSPQPNGTQIRVSSGVSGTSEFERHISCTYMARWLRGIILGAEVLQSVTAALECSIEVLDVEDCTIYTYGKGPVLGLLHYDHSHYWVAGRVADWWDWSAQASASSNFMSVLD